MKNVFVARCDAVNTRPEETESEAKEVEHASACAARWMSENIQAPHEIVLNCGSDVYFYDRRSSFRRKKLSDRRCGRETARNAAKNFPFCTELFTFASARPWRERSSTGDLITTSATAASVGAET